jgi:hypothetical protein
MSMVNSQNKTQFINKFTFEKISFYISLAPTLVGSALAALLRQ